VQCLAPEAIPLPTASLQTPSTEALAWLNQPPTWAADLQTRPLSQVLSWEQISLLLSQPEFVTALYQYQQQLQQAGTAQPEPASATTERRAALLLQLGQTWQALQQNLQQNLQKAVASTQQALQQVQQNWLPLLDVSFTNLDLAPAGLRSWHDATITTPVAELERLLRKLRASGLTMTPNIRAGYQDVALADVNLRLYAATWPMPNAPEVKATPAEWGRLLIVSRLTNPPGQATHQSALEDLPGGLTLQVFNPAAGDVPGEDPVVEHQIAPDAPEPYLYVYFLAACAEDLAIRLSLADGTTLQVPPLALEVHAL
jgi:hypothetical protein